MLSVYGENEDPNFWMLTADGWTPFEEVPEEEDTMIAFEEGSAYELTIDGLL